MTVEGKEKASQCVSGGGEGGHVNNRDSLRIQHTKPDPHNKHPKCLEHHTFYGKKKVKESRNRSGVAQRVPGGLGSQTAMTFGTCRW